MRSTFFAVLACAAGAAGAQGAVITFAGPSSSHGTGFGSVLNVLSVQANGSEWGSVLRSGGADVLAGNATNQSATRTVAELTAMTVSAYELGLIFNINQTGANPSLTLQTFTVRFYDSSDSVLFDAVWNQGPMTLAPVNQGTGGAGYRFDIALTPAEAALFFGDPGNRVGMIVPQSSPILSSNDGPDNFYLLPAPGSLGLLLGAGVVALRRRR